jgi:glycosyltransferase involved in cell wall biosynthesis
MEGYEAAERVVPSLPPTDLDQCRGFPLSPSARNAAQPGTYRVLIIFNTTSLYGMERATIETFDLLRPEVEPLFLMTYTAHRLDLPVLREIKRRQLEHTFLSDLQAWPRLAKPTSAVHLWRMFSAFVRGNMDSLRAARRQDAIYLPSANHLGLALLPALWFRLSGRRVLVHFHELAPMPRSVERWAHRIVTDAIHNTELGMHLTLAGNPALRHKRNAALSIRTDASQSESASAELRRQFTGKRNLFFVGQVSRHKGTDLLLDAVKMLVPDHPDMALHFIGGCADEAQLRADISSRGLDQVVQLWGFREDVVGLMRFAEILIHPTPPSRYAESFGRSVVEAMATGVPTVCFRSGVLPEIVDHGRTGWVCDSESAAALADGIRALLDDPSFRERLARGAREKYETHYADANVRERWLEWLQP